MKRLLSFLGAITVMGTTATTVVSCQSNKTSLSSIIQTTNLGPIAMAGGFPTLAELIPAIQAKNPSAGNLNASNIRFWGQPHSTFARVEGIGAYRGFVNLIFTRSTGPTPIETDLTKIILNTNLGGIVMAGTTPTAAELLAGIQAVNTRARNLTTADFTASNVTGTSATVTGTNGYTGTVGLTYTRQTNLANIITTTNLGAIAMANPATGPTADELLAGIKAVNPNAASLTTSNFTVSGTATPTAATINGAAPYTGTVNLTYTAKQPQTDITQLITNTTLGAIGMVGATPTLQELLTAIKLLNPNAAALTTANIQLSGTPTATQATITGVSPYTGTVNLNFTKL